MFPFRIDDPNEDEHIYLVTLSGTPFSSGTSWHQCYSSRAIKRLPSINALAVRTEKVEHLILRSLLVYAISDRNCKISDD